MTARAPQFPAGTEFIDSHMHCGIALEEERCEVGSAWSAAAGEGAAGFILSTEHWTVSLGDPEVESLLPENSVLGLVDQQNEIAAATAAAHDHLAFFASLECWHDTPYGDGWADACKTDARKWVRAGASGFKDHAGKQWQSDNDGPVIADTGVFAGAWSRLAGRCPNAAGETPNRDCVRRSDVVYPLLTAEWREVVRYIVEELRAPILTHATTYYGAEALCWDPLTQRETQCAPMSRQHLLDFLDWVEANVEPSSRRRIIIGHGGFMVPGERLLPRSDDSPEVAAERERLAAEMLTQLDEVLATGVSVETATTKDLAAYTFRQGDQPGACQLRDLFARYPDQLMLGTDGQIDRDECLQESYRTWEDLLTRGVREQGPLRNACFGQVQTYGLDLDSPTIAECDAEVPEDVVRRFLVGNFLNLYDE